MIFRPEITCLSQLLAWPDLQNGLTNKGFRKGCFDAGTSLVHFLQVFGDFQMCVDRVTFIERGGSGFSDTGVSGILSGQYSNRRADIHEKAKT